MKGNLRVDIDSKTYVKLKKLAKKQGKSVDQLAKEILLKKMKKTKRSHK
jgi:hypothetical protein